MEPVIPQRRDQIEQEGRVTWARSPRKNSRLFLALLERLLTRYADKRVIHLILDNFKINSSKQVRAWMEEHGERIRQHFLPPYSPDDNRIEAGLWRPMHAAVTYNQAEENIDANVTSWRQAVPRSHRLKHCHLPDRWILR